MCDPAGVVESELPNPGSPGGDPGLLGWDPAGVREAYTRGVKGRNGWFIGMALALLGACGRRTVPVWENIEIAPKVIVSIRPGSELVQLKLHNGSRQAIVIDAPNSWNLSMTLEGQRHALAIDPPEPQTRTTVAAGESRKWEVETASLLREYQPAPQGTYLARVWYDPNPNGSPKTLGPAITKLQAVYLP